MSLCSYQDRTCADRTQPGNILIHHLHLHKTFNLIGLGKEYCFHMKLQIPIGFWPVYSPKAIPSLFGGNVVF